MALPGTNGIIDISRFQQAPDFKRIKDAGIVGVIGKATQGVNGHDPKYAQHKAAAKAQGLLWGAYHFGTGSDPIQQADDFVDTAAVGDNELLVLDYERNPAGTQMTIPLAKRFIKRVAERTGRMPGLYSGHNIREDLGDAADPDFAKCWLWTAHYAEPPAAPKIHKTWFKWTIWQYTDGVNGPQPRGVPGINGNCDRDTFNGDLAALTAFWTSGGRQLS